LLRLDYDGFLPASKNNPQKEIVLSSAEARSSNLGIISAFALKQRKTKKNDA
jgi:hypothetical protein